VTFLLQYKGFDYAAFFNGAYEDSDSLPSLVQTGANSIEATLDYGIDVATSQVVADANYTDSLAALGNTIAQAESLGLSVMVRPLIDFLDPAIIAPYGVGDWRQTYQPTNVAAFFASYQQMIVAEAEVAQQNGAQMLSIGAELDQLAGAQYLPYWTAIISAVRAVFSGQLTYSASWNTASNVSFWNLLDYEGIDCYVPLSNAANPTLQDLVDGWTDLATPSSNPGAYAVIGNQSPIQYFDSLAAQSGKPLLFTELGYANDSGAAADPSASGNSPDPTLQADLYQAFFQAWAQSGSSSLIGTYFWEWDPNGSTSNVGPGIDSFSPQNSPAQNVVTGGFALNETPVFGVVGDFTGGSESGIVWESAAGTPTMWLMNGSSVASQTTLPTPPSSWQLIASGDFNGNGTSDLLWQNTDGQPAIWMMNGANIVSAVALANPTTAWHIVGTGDFNGNGNSDILWQASDGTPAIWMMNGTNIVSAVALPNPTTAWHIVGTGDFNGNDDILWQATDGTPAIWMMNGTNIVSAVALPTPPSSWKVIGTGDFGGNNDAGILWQNSDGTPAIWIMNGTNIVSAVALPDPGSHWKLVGAGNFYGAGDDDLLFVNSMTQQTQIWVMNGTQVASMQTPATSQAALASSPVTPLSATPMLTAADGTFGKQNLVTPT
jgi:hypothetical protein